MLSAGTRRTCAASGCFPALYWISERGALVRTNEKKDQAWAETGWRRREERAAGINPTEGSRCSLRRKSVIPRVHQDNARLFPVLLPRGLKLAPRARWEMDVLGRIVSDGGLYLASLEESV